MLVDLKRLSRIIARRRGLFTRADARDCGISTHQVRRRVAAGEWHNVVGPVFASAAVPVTPELRDRALQLAVPGSVLAGPSAARALGMPITDQRACLLVQARRRVRIPGADLLYGELDPADFAMADGVPITWRQRTVFDCLRVLSRPAAIDLLDEALQQGWASIDSLVDHTRVHIGHRGVPKVVSLLREAVTGTRSGAERILLRLLREAGICGWSMHAPIVGPAGPVTFGDVVFSRGRLVVEVNGWAYQTSADRLEQDRQRLNRLAEVGWAVLSFTWRDLTERPDEVVVRIRSALSARGGDRPS
jgi:very-short-patch-repair endonuclease